MAPNAVPLFPHLTSTGPPPTALTVVEVYRNAFRQRMAEGTIRPLVLPYHIYGLILLVIYLCIPHKQSPIIYAARWPVLGVISWWQWKTLWEASSMSMATAFLAGLVAAWGVVWSWTWLLLQRPQWDAKRVERRKRWIETGENGKANGAIDTPDTDNPDIRRRVLENGHSKHVKGKERVQVEEYYWQSYPDNLSQRFPWVVDLLVNFRGPGWNWQIPCLPTFPPFILGALSEPITRRSLQDRSPTGLRRFPTRASLLRSGIPKFIVGYFLLDALKTFLVHDPYFIFGPTTYSLSPFLRSLSPLQLWMLRLSITALAVIVALEMIFFLSPLAFCIALGPSVIGLRGESWYYPTTWGSLSNIFDKGLAGLWGGWWHQTFRFAFSAPSNYLIREGYVQPRSIAAKLVSLLCAFGISGILHTAGSISQFAPTKPLHLFVFFCLQGLGIFIQTSFCTYFSSQISDLPRIVRRAGNLVFALAWMFATGRWLADDFARGGVWLLEPVPFSLFRALGYGEKGTGWWCWGWLGVEWYQGERWWENGIAI